jgi:phage tail sheath protein FI
MANFVSPGVYTIEKDVSDYAPSVNPSIVGLVGFASRGPVDTPTLLTNPAQVLRDFGTPDLVTGGQGIYAALEILQKTNQVYYVRAATTNAKDSRYTIPLVTHPSINVCTSALTIGIDADMNGLFAFRFDVDAWDKNGNSVGDSTTFYAYRDRPYASGLSIMPAPLVAGDMTTQDWQNAIQAGVGEAVNPTTGPFCFIPSGYDASVGMLVGKEPGATAGNTSRLTVNTFISSSLTVGGTAKGAFDFTGTWMSGTPLNVNDMSWSAIGGIATDSQLGAVSGLRLFSTPKMSTGPTTYFDGSSCVLENAQAVALGFKTGLWDGNVPSGALLDYVDTTQAGAYQIQSLYPGIGYNYSAMNYTGGLQYRGLQADIVHTNDQGRFVTNISSDGGLEESYSMGMWKPTSTTSATSIFPEDVLNQGITNAVSQYVEGNFYRYDASIEPSGVNTWTPPTKFTGTTTISTAYTIGGASEVATAAFDFRCLSLDGTANNANIQFDLSGGKNGDASDYGGNLSNSNVRTALIGQNTNQGLQALDSEATPVTMASVPGVTDQTVQNALVSLAESTQNFLAVVSPPVGFRSAQQAIAWSNGQATGRTAALNSSYAALYWPWVKSFDQYVGADAWFDPSIYAIGQMCYTDEVSDPWFAPAGLRRGRLTNPTDVEVQLNQGDRDALYGPGNIVNPITKFQSDGIVIYGQRTTQRASTALDRINVRRLMIYLRRLVLQGARRFVFEPNDPITWEAVRNVISPALADIQQRRGITAFSVVCDATTNTPLRVDRNELWCKVILKPTKTAEILVFELNLTNQSASV